MAAITLTRDPDKLGRKDEWAARADGMEREGLGRNRAEALDSLIRSNLEAFGIEQVTDIDPLSANPVVHWVTGRFMERIKV